MLVGRQPREVAILQVECALCHAHVDVSVIARVTEDQNLSIEPGLEDLWAHRFLHEERGELERRLVEWDP
jgi:hypothetical protein